MGSCKALFLLRVFAHLRKAAALGAISCGALLSLETNAVIADIVLPQGLEVPSDSCRAPQ